MNLLGIGVDIEMHERLAKNLEPFNKRFMDRVFSSEEQKYCLARANPAQHFSARFCAKEAAIKASASLGKFVVSDFQVTQNEHSVPVLKPWSSRAEVQTLFQNSTFFLSLSHDIERSIAFVTLVRKVKET